MARDTNGKYKNLLTKTLRYFSLYALVVLAASVPAYYYLVDKIWLKELDEHNQIMADKTHGELNALKLTDDELTRSIGLWNKIQAGTNLRKIESKKPGEDSFYTVLKRNIHVQNNELKRYRGLGRNIILNGRSYRLTIETNVEETEETVMAIAIVTFLFFLLLVVGFLLLNRWLSVQLWSPFRNTLQRLKTFRLSNQKNIQFEPSDISEFEELNGALNELIEQNLSVYKTQKEFTENASHELQTPLAVIKNKLDLLLQNETVSDRQYSIIEEINRALTRISRINKNLLLLAKIDNHQFDQNEMINLSLLVDRCAESAKVYTASKNMGLHLRVDNNIIITGNQVLIEIMINNLLMNAIRHSNEKAEIKLSLDFNGLSISNPGSNALLSDSLFRRFSKKSNETSGTGLGLSIVNEICNKHHWKINYQFENSLHIFHVKFF